MPNKKSFIQKALEAQSQGSEFLPQDVADELDRQLKSNPSDEIGRPRTHASVLRELHDQVSYHLGRPKNKLVQSIKDAFGFACDHYGVERSTAGLVIPSHQHLQGTTLG